VSPQIGTTVSASEIPAATNTNWSTQNGFMPVLADWGPIGQAIPITSLANAASQLGTPAGTGNPYSSRTTTCALAFDACDALFGEDGSSTETLYATRVVHGTPVSATLALAPSAALTLTAQYPGAGGNGIFVAVVNTGSAATITLFDVNGNVLAASPSLASLAALVAWAATTGLVTAVLAGSTLPATLTATAMSGGTDNRGSLILGDVTTALTALSSARGPGQVLAPNWTNTTLAGIWSALGAHAFANNRVALYDMDDGVSATAAIADYGSFGQSSVAGWGGFWAGNRNLPGITPNTTRTCPPSPFIAAKCAMADQAGNPNKMAAGSDFPLVYGRTPTSTVSGAPSDTYSFADLQTLAASNINTFQYINGPENYGFRAAVPQASDGIYYQLQHARTRMAVIAAAQQIGQPFVFDQLDGGGATTSKFGGALQGMLADFQRVGAVYGTTAAPGFAVDVGPDVNTPATIAAGELNANITVAFSPGAESVQIQINVVPITSPV
jgi:hypothetical protein